MGNIKKLSLCVLMLVLWVAATSVAVEYEIFDLGTLGGTESHGRGINDSGQIVGYARTSTGRRYGFLWDSTNGMQALGTLGGVSSEAWDINENGQVVGVSPDSSGATRAFLWDNINGMQSLFDTSWWASGINDACQIVGSGHIPHNHAFLWQNGSWINLGTLGGDDSYGQSINNAGQVVGSAQVDIYTQHAFLWENSNMIDLGALAGHSYAYRINNVGQVVGWSDTSQGIKHAFIWDNTNGMQDLGESGLQSEAYAINDSGCVVGKSFFIGESYERATLWHNGVKVALPSLTGSNLSGVAYHINNNGWIVGSAHNSLGNYRAILWKPIPEPTNSAPIADAGPDQTIEQTSAAGADVQLDGSGSSDPDGDPLTYDWVWIGGTATDVKPIVQLPSGATTITLTVSDGQLSDTDTVNINVVDTTPPDVFCPENITLKATEPSGVPISNPEIQAWLSSFYATDMCDPEPELNNDAPSLFPLGTTTVTFMATDESGNSSTCQATVTVIAHVTIDILDGTITPKTKWIKCQIWPPDGYSYADIDIENILLEWQIPVSRYSFNERKQRLIVMFPASGLNLEPSPDPLELTVSGALIDGSVFEGSDFVTVVSKKGKKN